MNSNNMSSVTNDSRKKRRTQSSDDDVDRISNLPESIISHILSLLPTADAVATCLLSTRWKFQWRNIHNLRFTDSARHFRQSHHTTIEQVSLFAYFVNKVLLFLDQKCIDKFCLEVDQFSDVHNVSNWIAAAVSRYAKMIKFLDWDCGRSVQFHMPCDLYTCKTLESLNLFGKINLNVPSVVCLPNLKTLSLEMVIYQCDESVSKLISGCSSLENLYVLRDVYDNVVNFTISSSTLSNITLDFDNAYDRFPEEFYYKLEINAPQLCYLELSDIYVLKDFNLENLCLLEEAHIRLDIDESLIGDDQYSKTIVKLLQGLYNVKNLSLLGDVHEVLDHVRFSFSFPRLSELTMRPTCWMHSLLSFVEGSKKLEVLNVFKYGNKHKQVICWNGPEKVPSCFLWSLKTVYFKDIHGVENELKMIAYILKYAKVLKTMTIQPNSQSVQKVTEFPRGSEECEVHFL